MRRCPQLRGVRLTVAAGAGAASSYFAIDARRGPSSSFRGAAPEAVADEGSGSSSSDDSSLSLTGDGDDQALRYQQARHRLSKTRNDAKTPQEPSAGLVPLARLDAGGTTYKEENADHASSASTSFLLGFDGSALLQKAAPSSSMANIATTAVEDPKSLVQTSSTSTVSLPISDPCKGPHEHGMLLTGETFFVGGLLFNEATTFWLDTSNKQVESGKWKLYNAVQGGAARKAARKGLRDAMADKSKTTFCFGGGQDDQVAALFSLPQEAKQITLVHKAGAYDRTSWAIATGNLVPDASSPNLDNWASWKQKEGRISPWIVAGKADTRGQEDAPTSKRRDGVAPLRVTYEGMKKVASYMYKPVQEWGDELESWGELKKNEDLRTSHDLHTMPVRVRAQGGPQAKSIDFRDGPLSSFPAGDYSVVIGENYWSNSDDNQGVTCVQAIACVADVVTTANYFPHRRVDNVLTIKVCTTADAQSLGRPQVFSYRRRHVDEGEPHIRLKLSPPGRPKWGKYVAGRNPGKDHLVAQPGSTWSWKIWTEVDSSIRLDFSREKVQPLNHEWSHLDGICISEVYTEDKVLTKVPFWLDTVCEAQGQDHTGYYNHFDNEGRVKCWGPVREWGPFLNTRRALSLKTCRKGSGFEGWTEKNKGSAGKLTVEMTMKAGKILQHSFDASDGLHKAGLETSVLFDSTADGGTGSLVSIAEEDLESVKLTVAGTNVALCIEQVVYESMVLTNVPFLLDLKLPGDNADACGSSITKVYGWGIQQCYTEPRVMKVSKSRLELRQCAVGWAVAGGSPVGKDEEVKLQFTTRKGDDLSVSWVSKHLAWKPNQDPTEPLIFPFESDDVKEIQIDVVSSKTMVCIAEVRLGVYSEEVVVEKNSFLLDKDNPACKQGAAGRTMLEVTGHEDETKLPCYDTTRRLPVPPRHPIAGEENERLLTSDATVKVVEEKSLDCC